LNAEYLTLIDQLSQTPGQIASLIQQMPLDQTRLKPSVNEFSVLETVCHLRDIEIEAYGLRIQRILTEECPTLADIDGAQLAVERDYSTQDLESALKAFTAARHQNIERLRATSAEGMARIGVLEGTGQITLGRLALLMHQHDEDHLGEIRPLCHAQSPLDHT
jgi:hypothetical protein